MNPTMSRRVKTRLVKSGLPMKTIAKRKYVIAVHARSLRCAEAGEAVEAAVDVVKRRVVLRLVLTMVKRAALLQ